MSPGSIDQRRPLPRRRVGIVHHHVAASGQRLLNQAHLPSLRMPGMAEMSLAHHDKPGTQHPLAEHRLTRRLQTHKHRDHRHTRTIDHSAQGGATHAMSGYRRGPGSRTVAVGGMVFAGGMSSVCGLMALLRIAARA